MVRCIAQDTRDTAHAMIARGRCSVFRRTAHFFPEPISSLRPRRVGKKVGKAKCAGSYEAISGGYIVLHMLKRGDVSSEAAIQRQCHHGVDRTGGTSPTSQVFGRRRESTAPSKLQTIGVVRSVTINVVSSSCRPQDRLQVFVVRRCYMITNHTKEIHFQPS